ncbi:hypothetical protein ABFA07_019443 [Porites harrisoni]
MSKLVFVVICMLAAVNAYSANGRRKYAEGKPSMLWERGIIPEYEDNPDVYRDTAWLLDRIMMDEAQVLHDDEFEPPSVKYRHGSGDKQECINGAKSIPYYCQWTGWVVLKEDGEPEQLKLTVSNKYCNRDGQTKPDNKVVEC